MFARTVITVALCLAAAGAALANSQTMYRGYGSWEAQEWARNQAPKGDIPAIILTGDEAATRDDLYTETGFRTTGFRERHKGDYNSDYRSFGVWAQDSFWGFWNETLTYVSNAANYDTSDQARTAFLAGGRNPTKPLGTGTWRGLAIGSPVSRQYIIGNYGSVRYTGHDAPDSEIRVGRSELKVNLDASEVDVTITGVTPEAVIAGPDGELITAAGVLRWEGVPLGESGLFNEPREYGEIASLDDAFASDLLREGERYVDKASSIKGQFYGKAGREVTGVFWKNGYYGSFGAYKE